MERIKEKVNEAKLAFDQKKFQEAEKSYAELLKKLKKMGPIIPGETGIFAKAHENISRLHAAVLDALDRERSLSEQTFTKFFEEYPQMAAFASKSRY